MFNILKEKKKKIWFVHVQGVSHDLEVAVDHRLLAPTNQAVDVTEIIKNLQNYQTMIESIDHVQEIEKNHIKSRNKIKRKKFIILIFF
jgi:hypothetical protein